MRLKDRRLFQDLERHKALRVFPEWQPLLANRAVPLFRPMAINDRGVQAVLDGAGFTYSMSDAHLEQDSSRRVLKWRDDHDILLACPPHIGSCFRISEVELFTTALSPRAGVTIHSFADV